jgi:nitrogen fixation protein NifT
VLAPLLQDAPTWPPDPIHESAPMKVMIRKTSTGVLSAYVPKKDLEEPIVAQERRRPVGRHRHAGNGWVLALPEMAAGTTLPITVEARRLSGD